MTFSASTARNFTTQKFMEFYREPACGDLHDHRFLPIDLALVIQRAQHAVLVVYHSLPQDAELI